MINYINNNNNNNEKGDKEREGGIKPKKDK